MSLLKNSASFDFDDYNAMEMVMKSAKAGAAAQKCFKRKSEKCVPEFWSWDSILESVRSPNFQYDGLEVPTWHLPAPRSGCIPSSGAKMLLTAAMQKTALDSRLRGEATGGWLCEWETLTSSKNNEPDVVIHIPHALASHSKGGFHSTQIFAHSSVLLPKNWNLTKLKSTIKKKNSTAILYETTMEANGCVVLQAIRFAYDGVVGIKKHNKLCGPLLAFASSIGYEELCAHLLSTPPPLQVRRGASATAEEIAECVCFFLVKSLASSSSSSSSYNNLSIDVATFCDSYETSDQKILLGCLHGMPLYVASQIIQQQQSDFEGVQSARFLELWSKANLVGICSSSSHTHEEKQSVPDIQNEIVSMVDGLKLPDWYFKRMLGGGSAIASVCAGTPKGEIFLQEKFMSLESQSAQSTGGGLHYARYSASKWFEFIGIPTGLDYEFIGGNGCVIATCNKSIANLATWQIITAEEEAVNVDFSSINIGDYGVEAYVIPVWTGSSSSASSEELGNITYAVIRDDPMSCMARSSSSVWEEEEEMQSSLFLWGGNNNNSRSIPQVCVILSSSSSSSSGAEPYVLDSWELNINSDDLSQGMIWGGVYLPQRSIIGWSSSSSSLYIVCPYRDASPKIEDVQLSCQGCYCVVESLEEEATVVCIGPDGEVQCVSLISSYKQFSIDQVSPRALSVCSIGNEIGEFAVLYVDCIRIYRVATSMSILPCYTVDISSMQQHPSSIVSCQISGTIYTIDSELRVYILERIKVDEREVLDKFFQVSLLSFFFTLRIITVVNDIYAGRHRDCPSQP